jgi:hypothetical protein
VRARNEFRKKKYTEGKIVASDARIKREKLQRVKQSRIAHCDVIASDSAADCEKMVG